MRQTNTHSRRHHGVALIYVTVAMVAFLAMTSLAIDVSHVRLVKLELQAAADASAQAAGTALSQGGSASSNLASSAASMNNADGSRVSLNISTDVVFGTWNTSTSTFTAKSSWSSSANAVKVYARRTAATSNAVQTLFAGVVGIRSVDVIAFSVAYVTPASSTTVTINGTDDPWLAGMPNGSTASYDDTAPANSPMPVSIPITPGTYVTLTNVSGGVNHDPSQGDDGPEGNTSQIYSHGADSPGGPTPAAENGIADALMPIDALLGVFLGSNAPNTQTAPSRLDYSTAASRDQPTYTDIQLQQPFFIGDGQTSGATTQSFLVPQGATRLFLGTMDGHQWENNTGSFTATVNVPSTVQLVQ